MNKTTTNTGGMMTMVVATPNKNNHSHQGSATKTTLPSKRTTTTNVPSSARAPKIRSVLRTIETGRCNSRRVRYYIPKRRRRGHVPQVTAVANVLLLFMLQLSIVIVNALIPCTTKQECEIAYLPSSECNNETGYCTNPYTYGGCLYQMKSNWTKLRVCNSEDPIPEYVDKGYCRLPEEDFDHLEIRISPQDWESGFLLSWLMQILLSEVLDVPTTIETSLPDKHLNFYDIATPFDFGLGNDWQAFNNSVAIGGDCTMSTKYPPEEYVPCCHYCPEVWETRMDSIRELIRADIVEPALGNGILGDIGFFIPKFSVEQDPTLVTYLGLQGDENRHKLAKAFKRPTRWGTYCDFISSNSCTIDDGVAKRAPTNDIERDRMFVEGIYTGHFRYTEKNDCTLYPSTCTGHFADFPCNWTSAAEQIIHHLRMGFDTDRDTLGEYAYERLLEAYLAANSTKENIILHWWSPESIEHTFAGTDFEFLQVHLPRPNRTCYENRVKHEDRCMDDATIRHGTPLGVCGVDTEILHKVVSTKVYELTHDPTISDAQRSPALDAMRLFSVSALQLGEIFQKWYDRQVDHRNFDPRYATCEWFVANFDEIRDDFVPRTYPRISRDDNKVGTLFYAALILGGIATLLSFLSMGVTYQKRQAKAIMFAQTEFLWILLCGLVIICIGSITMVLHPTNALCISTVWFINLGYTLEFVPLVVKIAALNILMQSARKMKRLVLRRRRLFSAVFGLTFISITYLCFWTYYDPPRREAYYELTDDVTDQGDTIVSVTYHCESGAVSWGYVALMAVFLYLIIATVLAVQTRKVRKGFNESRTLAIMIYSHFMFALLRVGLFFIADYIGATSYVWTLSITISCDVIATVCIYFVPKFLAKRDPMGDVGGGGGAGVCPGVPGIRHGASISGSRSSNSRFSIPQVATRIMSIIQSYDPNDETPMDFDDDDSYDEGALDEHLANLGKKLSVPKFNDARLSGVGIDGDDEARTLVRRSTALSGIDEETTVLQGSSSALLKERSSFTTNGIGQVVPTSDQAVQDDKIR